MPSPEEKYEMHTSNPEQRHVQRFTRRGIVNLLKAEGFEVSEWWNTFVILSVFRCRSGVSLVERLDSWAADHLPPACASGWFLTVARRDDSAAIAGGVSLGSVREG